MTAHLTVLPGGRTMEQPDGSANFYRLGQIARDHPDTFNWDWLGRLLGRRLSGRCPPPYFPREDPKPRPKPPGKPKPA